jgi:phosphoribosylglycinamide formyltransferase-1
VGAGVGVDLVVSDRPCLALDKASSHGLVTALVDRRDFGGFTSSFDRSAFSAATAALSRDGGVSLVAMAGFGTVLAANFHEAHLGRVLNTHPSLLPQYKGWHAVRDASADGALETGCTMHVATEALDEGPYLTQVAFDLGYDRDEALVHERIKVIERALFPTTLLWLRMHLGVGRLDDLSLASVTAMIAQCPVASACARRFADSMTPSSAHSRLSERTRLTRTRVLARPAGRLEA